MLQLSLLKKNDEKRISNTIKGIVAIIREHYDRCWKGRITFKYEDYMKEIITSDGGGAKQVNLEPIAKELKIPIEELKRIKDMKTVTDMKVDFHA